MHLQSVHFPLLYSCTPQCSVDGTRTLALSVSRLGSRSRSPPHRARATRGSSIRLGEGRVRPGRS
eukprot:3612681-Prymnesium_polylepis.2